MTTTDSRTGRIQTLAEARKALGVPLTETKLLGAGTPYNNVIAIPVVDDESPEIVAEFAAEVVLSPNGRELFKYDAARRLRRNEMVNVLWIAYGPIVESSDGALVIGQLSVGPALGTELARDGDDPLLGVRTGLLRVLSPPRLLAQAVEYLRSQKHWLEGMERRGGRPMPTTQAAALERVSRGGAPKSKVSHDQIAAIAEAYVTLYRFGVRNPSIELAGRFGLTREQVRDRIHRARTMGYLAPTKQGRIGADPGPKLLAYWNPPEVKGDTDV